MSDGTKNFGYKTKNGKVCCKVRGFTLSVRDSAQLNYEVMRHYVLYEITDLSTMTDETSISSTPTTSFEILPSNVSKSAAPQVVGSRL